MQSWQIEQMQADIANKAKSLVGSEMIFDLIEHCKELLAGLSAKKVSFHDEMTMRKIVDKSEATRVAAPVPPIFTPEINELGMLTGWSLFRLWPLRCTAGGQCVHRAPFLTAHRSPHPGGAPPERVSSKVFARARELQHGQFGKASLCLDGNL